VCSHESILVAEALVWARQRPPQFPLRPLQLSTFQAVGERLWGPKQAFAAGRGIVT
jgi:hypothetical protein